MSKTTEDLQPQPPRAGFTVCKAVTKQQLAIEVATETSTCPMSFKGCTAYCKEHLYTSKQCSPEAGALGIMALL